HDDRRAALADVVLGGRRRGETLIGSGRDVELAAEVLGEPLRAFEPSGGLRRTERLDARGLEVVDGAGAGRRLRGDHDEVDLVDLAEGDHQLVVGDVERYAHRLLGDAGVARRAPQLVGERARGDLPGQRMLAAAGAEEKDVHALRLPGGRWRRKGRS